jgi:hypothetical protein
MLCLSYYLLCFFLLQNWRTRGQDRFCPEADGKGEVAQIMYIHMSICKNDKIFLAITQPLLEIIPE